MKKGQISEKISPHKYEEARKSIHIAPSNASLRAVEFRNNFEYNTGQITCFSARLAKK